MTQPTPSTLRFAFLAPILALALALPACAPWATYPPIDGAAQIGMPEFEPVPSIMAEAIRYAYERHGAMFDDVIVFNLPEGIDHHAYEVVQSRLREHVWARWMTPEDEFAIHVTAVRVRAGDSEVDVVYPRRDGHHELISVTLRQRLLYRHVVTGSRLWRIHAAVPNANYVPPVTREQRDAVAHERERTTTTDDANVHVGASPDDHE